MWERACSRKRCISHPMHQLKDRIREQARSHNGSAALNRTITTMRSPTCHPPPQKNRSTKT
ncbi:hypothetical protein DYL59_14290 [Pseudomonas kairouanensis]|uniref:Uncharacterized protein n=1 Tax=Pseudomonas kairouanensis TaxID=2293832 RepID=A0A4Z0APT4_9PSED|nr:hypothetical protein DYL59_14290 [Pseudomonas kairouanensis]